MFILHDRGIDHVFADAWAACADCAPLVEHKQMNRLLERVIAISPAHLKMSRAEKRKSRSRIKKIYEEMYAHGVEHSESLETTDGPTNTSRTPEVEASEQHPTRNDSDPPKPIRVGDLIAILRHLPSRHHVRVSVPSAEGSFPLTTKVHPAIDPDPKPGAPGRFVLLYLQED